MENLKIEIIFPYFFLSLSLFLPRLVKNVLKMNQNFFFQIFMKTTTYPNFDMESLKIENIF